MRALENDGQKKIHTLCSLLPVVQPQFGCLQMTLYTRLAMGLHSMHTQWQSNDLSDTPSRQIHTKMEPSRAFQMKGKLNDDKTGPPTSDSHS